MEKKQLAKEKEGEAVSYQFAVKEKMRVSQLVVRKKKTGQQGMGKRGIPGWEMGVIAEESG